MGRCCGAAGAQGGARRGPGRQGLSGGPRQPGDQATLRAQELLDAAEVGELRPRWEGEGFFTVAPPTRIL